MKPEKATLSAEKSQLEATLAQNKRKILQTCGRMHCINLKMPSLLKPIDPAVHRVEGEGMEEPMMIN